ncbi:hypothetical protein [Flavobacterium alkalisoli]|uniref:hypothetical protein n=1 Tax=Flavobacterium alkalisoli TaxID=2602769 RepID=UPI003A946FA6
MKKLLLSVLFISVFSYGQQSMSFKEAKEKGIYPEVENVYKPAIGPGGVFTTDEDVQKHIEAYQNFLKGLGDYLVKNNFKWEETTKGFNRIYMDITGKVEYYLYDFKTDITQEKEKEFNRLLNGYIKRINFEITAPVKFAQCSPFTFVATTDK